MANIIVRQANSTSLTVQSSSNQVLVRQQPNNTVVVQTTGNSYVLPAATANTLGGIIVGDNLTINANGLLSAQAGGVTTFNNRTGNVTLTANDVSAVGNSLYFPLNNNITSGNATVAGAVYTDGGSGNGTLITRSFYGINKTSNVGSTSYQFASGLNRTQPTSGHIFFARETDATNLNQSEIQLESQRASLVNTKKTANGTLVYEVGFGSSFGTALLYYTTDSVYTGFEVGASGITLFGVATGTNNNPPGSSELLTKAAADRLYTPLKRIN